MNIKDAKEQIQNAISVYFIRDDYGNFVIPPERQRPVFLMGPPGIGKTAIMEQIASELGVGLLSYSMTHHTRQSALGLPFIAQKTYDGKEYSISEYTMSEIIASVYELMEASGIRKGILFLDEINCVSETLAPAMLQFLQYKTFGRHRVPDGWIVVTAGNPPEYNKSVREFDTVTWDRLKRIDVEPDFAAWKIYAYDRGVHPSVLTYLEVRKDDFYVVESTAGGQQFVTARGWVDLSEVIWLYEQKGISVDENLVSQYLQKPEIAKRFAVYYDLFMKYRSDYQIENILAGEVSPEIKQRAEAAKFDERYSLLGLILDSLSSEIRDLREQDSANRRLADIFMAIKNVVSRPEASLSDALEAQIVGMQERLQSAAAAANLSRDERRILQRIISLLQELAHQVSLSDDASYKMCSNFYSKLIEDKQKQVETIGKRMNNAFAFCEEAFSEGHELLIFVTELTINNLSAWFISSYGCEAYTRNNKKLLFHKRNHELITELSRLEKEEIDTQT